MAIGRYYAIHSTIFFILGKILHATFVGGKGVVLDFG